MKKTILLGMLLTMGYLFGQEIMPPKGDLNNDGVINATDNVLLKNYLAGNLDTLLTGGDIYAVDPIVGVLRYVPTGTFTQGSPTGEPCRSSEEPQFTHTLNRDLAVMATELTRQMWANLRAVQPTLPADPTATAFGAGMTNPVQNNTWYEAVLFANLLSLQQGLTRCYYTDAGFTTLIEADNYTTGPFYCDWDADGYRLPSEGEWERCCRAGTSMPFWIAEPNYTVGNCGSTSTAGMYPSLETAVWFFGSITLTETNPVGMKSANPWGLYDMHGNVWEWCWDWYGAYPAGSANDYEGATSGTLRVGRGGGLTSDARNCRSAFRGNGLPDKRGYGLGFRLVRTLP